ncbi:dmX-like protein 1 [Anneissia japonica]|uniref:dmX-like protein 1 n=1 Tax=Anneissia japonica TaxID=1529436 RepID=UPI001425A79A|nr:dmX-like protein 1 [Anneissia japonica]
MNRHQVLTGAVNPGENCFAVGYVDGVPFTAYASGCDIVILDSNLKHVQVIPGANHGNIQVGCIDCSAENGKVGGHFFNNAYINRI